MRLDLPPDLTRDQQEELSFAAYEFREGLMAFSRGDPRSAPHVTPCVGSEIWLSGWDAARKVREWSLKIDLELAREDAERDRLSIKLWRLNHPFAVLDGKNPAPREADAEPGRSTQR